jgi:hypothetical protein
MTCGEGRARPYDPHAGRSQSTVSNSQPGGDVAADSRERINFATIFFGKFGKTSSADLSPHTLPAGDNPTQLEKANHVNKKSQKNAAEDAASAKVVLFTRHRS